MCPPSLSGLAGDQAACDAKVGLWTDTRQWVLVLSINWGPPIDHERVFEQEEGSGEWTCDWIQTLRANLRWGYSGCLRRVELNLGVSFLSELWRKYGDPDGDGSFLAAKLLPRRLPGSGRVCSPTHLQLFGFL